MILVCRIFSDCEFILIFLQPYLTNFQSLGFNKIHKYCRHLLSPLIFMTLFLNIHILANNNRHHMSYDKLIPIFSSINHDRLKTGLSSYTMSFPNDLWLDYQSRYPLNLYKWHFVTCYGWWFWQQDQGHIFPHSFDL